MKSATEALHEDLTADRRRMTEHLRKPAAFKYSFKDSVKTPEQMTRDELLHVMAFMLDPLDEATARTRMYAGYLVRPDNPGARVWFEVKPNALALWVGRVFLGLVWVP